MAQKSSQKTRNGCLHHGGLFLLLLVAGGLIAAFYFMCLPQDLSDLRTAAGNPREAKARDLATVFRKAVEKGHSVTITEDEMNHWLAETLAAKQAGFLAEWVDLKGVVVRMEEEHLEIIQEREVLGRPFTLSLFVRLDQTEDGGSKVKTVHLNSGPLVEGLPYPRKGGRYGSLSIPEGFLLFVLPSFKKLAALFAEEIQLAVEEMESVRLEKGRVILQPWQVLPEQQKRPGPR